MPLNCTQTHKHSLTHAHTHVEIGQKQRTLCVKTHTRKHFGPHRQPKQAHHSFHVKAKGGSRDDFFGCVEGGVLLSSYLAP
jgi:hypothetical protein